MPKLSKLELFKKLSSGVAVRSYKQDDYIRAEKEDDDGYDPYSDRQPEQEDEFQEEPWK